MSGPRRPLPNQLERVSTIPENSVKPERTRQSLTETVDFSTLPAALPSKTSATDQVPPLPQMPATVGTDPTTVEPVVIPPGWGHQSSPPAPLLPSDSLVYGHPVQKPLLDFDLRNLATVGVAIATALAMVVAVSILGLRLGSDRAATTSGPSGFLDSGNSENVQGSAPTWVKGNAGVLDGDEPGRGSSDISSNQFSDDSANRLATRSQPRPLPPTTSPIVSPADLDSTDVSIGSNTNAELAQSTAGNQTGLTNLDGSAGGLSAIEPGSAVAAAFYANCTEARAAGVAPISKGSIGYRSALDADDDGVACETSASTKSPIGETKPSSSTTVADPTPTVSATVTARTPIERTTTSKGTTSTGQNATTTAKPTTTRRSTTVEKTTTARVTTSSRPTTTVRSTTTQRRTTTTAKTTTKPTTVTSATTTSSQTASSPSTTSRSTSSSSLSSTTSSTGSSTTADSSDNDLVELGNRATSGNRGRALGQSKETETEG